jgi:radical SAM protein with 4Fe4S-binding SPASM domain
MFNRRVKPLGEGIHTIRGLNEYNEIRFQFRIETDGKGVCIIDANRIIYMNAAGLQFAHLAVLDIPPKKAAASLKYMFKANPGKLRNDYEAFIERFRKLVFEPPSAEMFMDVRPLDLFKDDLSAPYRMDLAVTYKCDQGCAHCYVDSSRKDTGNLKDLDTNDFKRVIDRVVNIGIPHVIFTGGEATLRPDLPELIRYANEKRLVTGLNTNGRKLAEEEYAGELAGALLDHVQVTLFSADPAVHNKIAGAKGFKQTVRGIKNMIEVGIPVMTNTTVTKQNAAGIEDLIKFLADLGMTRFAVNSLIKSGGGKDNPDALSFKELETVLKRARTAARTNEMVMIWYSPTRYCDLNPMALGLGLKRCTAAHLAVCVEPNGDVLPCQSYYNKKLGNILKDAWPTIWDNKLAVKLRTNDFAPDECRPCEHWEACAGGCALEYLEKQGTICQHSN